MIRVLLLIALLGLFSCAPAAPPPPMMISDLSSSAEAVARDLIAALDEARWGDAAALMHPAIVERAYGEWREMVEREQEQAWLPLTVEMVLEHNPEMPTKVAEWQVRQHNESGAADHSPLSYLFTDVDSTDEFHRLSPEELYARHIAAADIPSQLRRVATRQLRDPEVVDEAIGLKRSIIGSVPEGNALVHVLVRVAWGLGEDPAPFNELDMITVERFGESWKVRSIGLPGSGPIGGPMAIGFIDDEGESLPENAR